MNNKLAENRLEVKNERAMLNALSCQNIRRPFPDRHHDLQLLEPFEPPVNPVPVFHESKIVPNLLEINNSSHKREIRELSMSLRGVKNE